MRIFVAIPLPLQVMECLKEWVVKHKGGLSFKKWVHPMDYHITVQFLGEASAQQVEALRRALIGIRMEPFTISLSEIGYFGSDRAPRVLWAGLGGNIVRLEELHFAVVDVTRTLGFVPEDRAYAPHITLARGYSRETREGNRIVLPAPPESVSWTVDGFALIQTHMNSSPMYEKIGSIPFH